MMTLVNLVFSERGVWCAICHLYVDQAHECDAGTTTLAPVIDMAAARRRHPTGRASEDDVA